MAKSAKYWDDRAIRRLTDAEKQSAEYSKRIQKIYDRANKNIQRDIEDIYRNYSKATGLDVQTLKELLTATETEKLWAEMKRRGLDQYVKGNYKARISRLEKLQAQVYAKAKEIYPEEQLQHTMCYEGVINNSYYKAIYDTQMGTGFDFAFSKIDDNMVKAMLNERWSGKNYSQRIWGNTDILAESVAEIVGGALMSGQSIAKTSRQIRERFDVGKYYADRLVRTETNHFNNEADAMAYEEMDVDKYVFLATLDTRTSTICQELDNDVFPLKERKVGKNYPPMHPNCRSKTRAYMGEEVEKTLQRRARNPVTGKNEIVGNISYKEWAKQHGIGKPSVKNGKANAETLAKIGKSKYDYVDNPYVIKGDLPPAIYQYKDYDDFSNAVYEWRKTHDGSPYDYYVDNSVWATSNLTSDQVERVKRFDATIAKLQKDYPLPTARAEKLYIGSYDNVDMYLNDIQRSRMDGGVAQAQFWYNPDTNNAVIGFNVGGTTGTLADDLKLRQQKIARGERLQSVLDGSPEGVAIHEWGHGYTDYIGQEMVYGNPAAEEYWNWYKSLSKDEIADGISLYATTNRAEFEAECFAELLTDNPRPIAVKFSHYLEKCSQDAIKRVNTYGVGAMRTGTAGKINFALDYAIKKDTSSIKTIILPVEEYAHVMSEIATNLSNVQKQQRVVSKAIDQHIYTFENNGFGEYRIIGKKPIDKEVAEWWDD